MIDALAEGNRSILLAALLSSRFILIVSGTDAANDLKTAQVFDQKAETLTSDKIYLQNAKTLKNTWSVLASLSSNLVAVLDAEGTSFIISCHSQNCSIINIDVHPKRMPSFTDHYEHDIANDVLISSNQNGIFYDISAKSNLSKITFNSSSENKLHHEKMSHLCKGSTSESVVVQTGLCKNEMGWQLTSGFIASDTVYLFNKSVVVFAFPQSAFTHIGKEVSLKMIQTRDFFVTGNPPKQCTFLGRFFFSHLCSLPILSFPSFIMVDHWACLCDSLGACNHCFCRNLHLQEKDKKKGFQAQNLEAFQKIKLSQTKLY